MAKKEKTEVNNYYSRSLSSEKIEEVNIQNVSIPEDFYDDSKDIIEADGQEDYVDFNDFEENMEEDLESLGFEGKTQEKLQEFIMQKLMGKAEEYKIQEEIEVSQNYNETTAEEIQEEITIENNEIEASTETIQEKNIDIAPAVNYTLPEEAPMSMFQMTEEETQSALENVQAEYTNANAQTNEDPEEETVQDNEEDAIYHDPFDEYKKETSSKKKYVFAIHQKYAFAIDEISVEEREEFIEHAIKLKIDADNNEKAKFRKIDFVIKLILIVATIVVSTPIAFKAINWSVDSTIKNYEYCQKSFEKLFKKRFHYQK